MLEIVVSYDLWILHAFFVAGSNNDMNVFNQSPLFIDVLKDEASHMNFMVNGHEYKQRYYLGDGIYPRRPVFMKTVLLPQTSK